MREKLSDYLSMSLCVRNYKIILKTKLTNLFTSSQQLQKMLRTLYTRLQYKTKFFNFPFNFEGLVINEEILRTRYLPMNQRCRGAMSKIFEEEIGDGFRYAFQNVLNALEEKDMDFLKSVCEPALYNQLEKSMDLLADHNLSVKADSAEEIDLNLKYTSFSFISGVSHNRQLNKGKDMYESSNLWNLKNGIDLQHYKPRFASKLHAPFMRVGCLISCPSGVYLKNDNGEVIVGQTSTSYHKVIFEGIIEDENQTSVEEVKEANRSIYKTMSNVDSEEKNQLIRKTFKVDNITWRIADIDNFMNGNPYVE